MLNVRKRLKTLEVSRLPKCASAAEDKSFRQTLRVLSETAASVEVSVMNLRSRLQKLEAQRTDTSRYTPGSAHWYEYWIDQAYRRIILKEPGVPIPITVGDTILARVRARRLAVTTTYVPVLRVRFRDLV